MTSPDSIGVCDFACVLTYQKEEMIKWECLYLEDTAALGSFEFEVPATNAFSRSAYWITTFRRHIGCYSVRTELDNDERFWPQVLSSFSVADPDNKAL